VDSRSSGASPRDLATRCSVRGVGVESPHSYNVIICNETPAPCASSPYVRCRAARHAPICAPGSSICIVLLLPKQPCYIFQ
jgi:hypothetical protein